MKAILLLLIGTWIGLVIGLSFVEAPLKFQAPGMTTKLGLGIGKLVFGYSNKIQLFLMAILLSSLIYNFSHSIKSAKLYILLLVISVSVQSIYLLPILDLRVDRILRGDPVSSSHHHLYFIGLEILKTGALIFLFINLYRQWTT